MIPPAPPVSFWNVYSTDARVGPCACREQRLHDRRVVLGRRQHQRRLATELLRGVDVGVRLEQQLDGVDVARARREHQRRFTFTVRRVRLGPGAKQAR